MSDINQEITLSLTFNADQISSLLNWEMLPDCSPTRGMYAGLLAMPAQSALSVIVSGNGAFDNPTGPRFSGFEIKDFSIVSLPKVMACGPDDPVPTFAPPSMFSDSYVATQRFQWQGTSREQSLADYLVIIDTLDYPLPLGAPGAWDVTIVLTIAIQRIDGSSDPRVFYTNIDAELYPAPD
jgi:hypothetical protein